jgi:hypothetical protein
MNRTQMILYGTSGCHLCEQAEALLLPLLVAGAAEVELVDIGDDDTLMARFGVKIPVLGGTDAGGRWLELQWPFDQAQVWWLSGQLSLMCQGS